MKLLITGSEGFIGRYAVKAALARGWEVDSIDIRSTSPQRRVDVRMLSRIEADCVLHLAGFSSNAGFSQALAENYANNVMGMWNVLRLAARCGARVVYASSSAVYGSNPEAFVLTESSIRASRRLPAPASHYGKSKVICEHIAESFRECGLSTLGLRIFNAYGAGDEAKPLGRQAPPTWMQAAKREGKRAEIFDDGRQSKDFIHVSDVVEIIMRLIESESEQSDAAGIVNIGTGVSTSFNALAQMIGCEVEYKPVPDPKSYQYFTRADTTRLLELIGPYKFKTLMEGLAL